MLPSFLYIKELILVIASDNIVHKLSNLLFFFMARSYPTCYPSSWTARTFTNFVNCLSGLQNIGAVRNIWIVNLRKESKFDTIASYSTRSKMQLCRLHAKKCLRLTRCPVGYNLSRRNNSGLITTHVLRSSMLKNKKMTFSLSKKKR